MVCAFVNDECVSVDYVLKNKDRVRIVTDILSYGPRKEWADIAKTSYARKRIKDFGPSWVYKDLIKKIKYYERRMT